MRTKKRKPDYGAISRSSIKKDFQRVQRYPTEEKTPQIEELPKINAERRIIHISDVSGYAKFARYIVGKLVRLKEKANVGGQFMVLRVCTRRRPEGLKHGGGLV